MLNKFRYLKSLKDFFKPIDFFKIKCYNANVVNSVNGKIRVLNDKPFIAKNRERACFGSRTPTTLTVKSKTAENPCKH